MKIKHLIIAFAITISSASLSAFAVTGEVTEPLTTSVDSISLSALSEGKVSWTTQGTSAKGFKVVWSKTEGPTYPIRESDQYQYLADSSSSYAYLHGFDGEGTYYVRVCEYLDGKCGTYSNQISLQLAAKVETTKVETDKFSDVSETNESYDAIYYLKDKQVVEGYADNSFKPDQPINRAEFLKIVMEVSDYDLAGANCYKDVQDEWYAKYVCKATELSLVEGYADGYFKPESAINFAEASKIIVNTLSIATDDANDENWYHKFVVSMEMLAAIPASVDNFNKLVTREEMAEMIYRVDANKTDKYSTTYSEIKSKENIVSEEKVVNSINLINKGTGKVGWTVDGYSKNGFKVVWSKTSNPTYPARSTDQAQYNGSAADSYSYLTGFDGAGTYYVRVCEYLEDGTCGVYSNQITVELEEKIIK